MVCLSRLSPSALFAPLVCVLIAVLLNFRCGCAVVQGAGDETCWSDRLFEDVQHAVSTDDGEGCCPDIWWTGNHEEWDGQVY